MTIRSIPLPQALLDGMPVAAGDAIFLGMSNSAVGSRDGATLAPRWTTYLYPPDSTSGDKHIEYQTTTPAIDDARLYVVSSQGVVDALDRVTGVRTWRHQLARIAMSPPLLAHGAVFVAGFDQRLTALDPATGEVRWRTSLGEDVEFTPPVTMGNSIYVGGRRGFVHRIDAATGAILWERKVATTIRNEISVQEGALVVADVSGIYAVNPNNGRALWSRSEPALNPVQDGGLVYVHARSGRLLVLDAATGHLVAGADLPEPAFFGRLVILPDRILVPCHGWIACVDKPAAQNNVVLR